MSKVQRWRFVALGASAVLAGPVLWTSLMTGGPTAAAAEEAPGVPPPGCAADLIPDDVIDVLDIVELIARWGPCADCTADLTGDGAVDANDLLEVILVMGACEESGNPLAGTALGHMCAVNDGSFMTVEGGCKDLATGLVWSTLSLGEGGAITWSYALDIAADSNEADYSDWRLPIRDELQTVIANGAEGHFSSEFDDELAKDLPYWTSENVGNRWAWLVHIASGIAVRDLIGDFPGGAASHFVAVRDAGSPPPPPPPPPACDNDGVCEPGEGENCENCDDCPGKQNGPPSGRYCCGNGVIEGPEADPEAVPPDPCDGVY